MHLILIWTPGWLETHDTIEPTLAIGFPGPMEWVIIGIIGLLIFGRRLPEVARSIGKSIVEFKRGIRDVEDTVNSASRPPKPGDRSLPRDGQAPLPEAPPNNASAEKSEVSSAD